MGFFENIFRMMMVRAPIPPCNPVFIFSLGGMDLYIQAFHSGGTHELFYTDPII